jgi:elongation factor P
MIPVTELKSGTTFKEKGEIFEVVSYQHTKIGRGSANIKIKAQNLRTGQQVQKTFISGSRVEEADTEKKKLQYLYEDSESLVFMDPKTYDQFPIKTSTLGSRKKFLKEGGIYELLTFEDEVLNVELPKLMELKVTETSPGVRGDTVSNVYKPATLENGVTVNVPMFVKEGDIVKIDTRTQGYVERKSK